MHDLSPFSAALLAYNFIIANSKREWGSMMTNVTAEMAKKPNAKAAQTNRAPKTSEENAHQNTTQDTALDHRYRQIGISAVAAAVRYQGVAKNPAYAPTPTKWQDRIGETSA
jgi:Flp pilus assembly protein TadB